ncbi:MAG: hypothetical protein ACJAUO_001568 [Sediminicola sp.]|jgi:hypothetical protein
MLEQSHTSLKKEVEIKTVPDILLCHFLTQSLAKVNIIFKNQIL